MKPVALVAASILWAIALASGAAMRQSMPSGTSSISGTVVIADRSDTAEALIVEAVSRELKQIHAVETDATGRFTFRNLAAGRYEISARRVPLVQVDPATGLASSRVVAVGSQSNITSVVLQLERGGSIGGSVIDETGQTPETSQVGLYRVHDRGEGPVLGSPITGTRTDDRGNYRFTGLAAGRYAVQVIARVQNDVPAERLAPIFFPATFEFTPAGAIVLGSGERRLDVNVTLRRTRAFNVSGVLLSESGDPATADQASWLPEFATSLAPGGPTLRIGPDGRFSRSGILPGPYRIVAQTRSGARTLWAIGRVVVQDHDISDVALRFRAGSSLTGDVTIESTSDQPRKPLAGAQIQLRRADVTGMGATSDNWSAITGDDGQFRVGEMAPGRYRIHITPPATGGTAAPIVRRIDVDGTSLTDQVVELEPARGARIAIAMTSAPSELYGTLTDADMRPAASYGIVVFPVPRDLRRAGSSLMRLVQTANDGSFSFVGLPAGRYFIAAVTSLDADEVMNPSILERIEGSAIAITLGDGERQRSDLRIGRR